MERPAIWKAALLGGAVSAALILAVSRGNVERMTIGDGLIYRYVASHLTTDKEAIDPVVSDRGTSLRYGRIGLPIFIWVASAGRPGAMPYVQPLLMILSGAAMAAAARALFPRAPPAIALAPFLAIGSTLALTGGFAEATSAALGLWAIVAAKDERWRWSAFALALALLTRENAGAIWLGVVVGSQLWRKREALGVLLLALVPLAGWYVFIASRFGHIPILDPYLRVKTSTIGIPGVAIIQSITHRPIASAVTAAIHLGLAFVGLRLWRRGLLGAAAAAAALQIFSAGRFSFHFIGEAVRAGAFLQLFVVLSIAESRLKAKDTLPT